MDAVPPPVVYVIAGPKRSTIPPASEPDGRGLEAGGLRRGRADGRGHADQADAHQAALLIRLSRRNDRRDRPIAERGRQRDSEQILAQMDLPGIETLRRHFDTR